MWFVPNIYSQSLVTLNEYVKFLKRQQFCEDSPGSLNIYLISSSSPHCSMIMPLLENLTNGKRNGPHTKTLVMNKPKVKSYHLTIATSSSITWYRTWEMQDAL